MEDQQVDVIEVQEQCWEEQHEEYAWEVYEEQARLEDMLSIFHRVAGLPQGDIDFLIDGILPEGVTFIGANSGVGKTWFALAMAKALTSGESFLGRWKVKKPTKVLYLCPEMGAKPFRMRCQKLGIDKDFWCQTIADGPPISLRNERLIECVRDLKPVIFLDTAIRFENIVDENSASLNATGLAKSIFNLLHQGAKSVTCLHHRSKLSAGQPLTLENTLRGTGDFGAMCDMVWGLRDRESSIEAACVKARDFETEATFDFRLPDANGKMEVVLSRIDGKSKNPAHIKDKEAIKAAMELNPDASVRELAAMTDMGKDKASGLRKEILSEIAQAS